MLSLVQEHQPLRSLKSNNMSTGLVFGTFDGIHEGHLSFLRQAKEYTDVLIASVPSDSLVEQFKAKQPRHPYEQRVSFLLETRLVDKVVPSDSTPGEYTILSSDTPDRILLGYDQIDLKKSLEVYLQAHKLDIPVILLSPYKPDQFKSSLLNL